MNTTIFGDYLNRDKILEHIYNYVVANTRKFNKSVCFGIDGQWGQGKSWVINKLECKFKGLDLTRDYSQQEIYATVSKDYFIFKYNAWELDYYEDPLIGIIITLFDQLNKINLVKTNQLLQGVIKKSVKILCEICGQISKKILGVDIVNAVCKISKKVKNFDDLSKLHSKTSRNSIIDDIDNLLIVLNELSEYKTIIFIVDEIDRCLPKYAIKTLERLHHVFTKVSQSFTIISTDESQLIKSIESTYGNSYNAKKYLEKFIMFSFVLSNGEMNQEEFINKVQNINNTIGYANMKHSEWDFIYRILDSLNAREKQLIFDRTIISLNTLIEYKNTYRDVNLLVGCIFISTLNYYIVTKRENFYISNVSPYYMNSGNSKFEKYLKKLFINIDRVDKITDENKLHFILLIVFTKKFLNENNRTMNLLKKCSYLNENLKEEIDKKIAFLNDYYEANKNLK